MNRLFLIDGSSMLSSSFYGNLPFEYRKAKTDEEKEKALKKVLKTSTGIYTNGVHTMTTTLLNLIRDYDIRYLAIMWDKERATTFRRGLYSEYKSNRKKTPAPLSMQFGVMQDLLDAMGVAQFVLEGYEADDLLGTFARSFEDQLPVVVCTADQDALQLASHGTRIWLKTTKAADYKKMMQLDGCEYCVPDGWFEFTPYSFEAIYGLQPLQMIDKKALEGDKSDFIPGVRGVGEESVGNLLREFGTIENLYEHIEGLDAKGIEDFKVFCKSLGVARSPYANLLKESDDPNELVGKKAAFLSKQLATINTAIGEFQDLRLEHLLLEIDQVSMREKFKELEFKSLLEKTAG